MCQALSLNLDGDLCLNIQLQRAHKQATRATTKKKDRKKKEKESARSLFFLCWKRLLVAEQQRQ